MPKTEDEWKAKLSEEEYRVLREKGTEAPFSGALLNEKASGMYKCKACGALLFDSSAKFDSGTGWPSFDEALPGAVKHIEDNSHGTRQNESFGLVSRTEVVCANCGSHLGHIFPDGPTKTGKRYCLNSVCLDLATKDKN